MHSKIGDVTLVVITETIILVSFLTSTHLTSLPGARFSNEIGRLKPQYYITWYLNQNSSLSNGFQGPLLLTWINFNPSVY